MQLRSKIHVQPLILHPNAWLRLPGSYKFTGYCKDWIRTLKVSKTLDLLLQYIGSFLFTWLFKKCVTMSASLMLDLQPDISYLYWVKGASVQFIVLIVFFVKWHPVAKCTNHHVIDLPWHKPRPLVGLFDVNNNDQISHIPQKKIYYNIQQGCLH